MRKRTNGLCSTEAIGKPCRSEGFALVGYVVPGCVEDGAWMIWKNSSVAAAVVVAHPDFGKWAVIGLITTPAIPGCADRSVSSSEYRRHP